MHKLLVMQPKNNCKYCKKTSSFLFDAAKPAKTIIQKEEVFCQQLLAVYCAGGFFSLSLYQFFQTHQKSDYVTEVLNGLKSASLGLIISAAFTMIQFALYGENRSDIKFAMLDWKALFLLILMLFMVRKWKVNPVVIMLISGIFGSVLICFN